jgi:hypothetical protein
VIITGNETITIRRKAETGFDQHGLPSFTVTEIDVDNCLYWFGSTDEPVEVMRDPVDANLVLCFPEGTEIVETDEFVLQDNVWVKDGIAMEYPQLWANFVPGVLVNVRRRDG